MANEIIYARTVDPDGTVHPNERGALVRCADCRWWQTDGSSDVCEVRRCLNLEIDTTPGFYCAAGERRL